MPVAASVGRSHIVPLFMERFHMIKMSSLGVARRQLRCHEQARAGRLSEEQARKSARADGAAAVGVFRLGAQTQV